MIKDLALHKNVSKKCLLKNGFTELSKNRFVINKILFNQLIILKLIIDLNEMEVQWDVIDKNTQGTYYPFWNNINGTNNLVAVKVIENFDKFITELQAEKVLKGDCKHEKRNN